MIVKTEVAGYVRDTTNHSILNNNLEAWNAHKQQRAILKQTTSLEDRVQQLSDDVSAIKSLLQELILLNKK